MLLIEYGDLQYTTPTLDEIKAHPANGLNDLKFDNEIILKE